MTKRSWRLALLSIAVAGGACRAKSPVETLLSDIETRVEARDAAAVAELLSSDFRALNGMTKADVLAEMKRYFFAYESLDVSLSEAAPSGEPPNKLSVRIDMEGKPRQVGGLGDLVPGLSAWRFDLDLVAQDGRLLISGGRWERVDRAGP